MITKKEPGNLKKKGSIEKHGGSSHVGDLKCVLEDFRHPVAVIKEGVELLKSYFPKELGFKGEQLVGSITSNLERLEALLDGALGAASDEEGGRTGRSVYFDILHQIQQVCATHDQLFLHKQLRYHVTASADMPKVFAPPDQILVVLSHLVSNAIKHAPRSSEILIKTSEVTLRQGAGVEVTVINENKQFTERDRFHLFEEFYQKDVKDGAAGSNLGLAVCREIIHGAHGQLWVDVPSKGKVAFTFVLPCVEIIEAAYQKNRQTFKYDITVVNYVNIRDAYGEERSKLLLSQVEACVRNLVRYPIDVVTSFEKSGVVSTIYETQEGNANSVAARISQKLGAEIFQIGKESTPMTFRYHLSILQ